MIVQEYDLGTKNSGFWLGHATTVDISQKRSFEVWSYRRGFEERHVI